MLSRVERLLRVSETWIAVAEEQGQFRNVCHCKPLPEDQ
jgi:hypothetical protein